jgi:hypothetical protein
LPAPRNPPEPRVTLDWRRLKAVVLESDDWGLCAWVPDEAAHRALAGTAAFRDPAARAYTRSTLEHAQDVARLSATLLEFQGRDGRPPVWQANTVMATPDYARLTPPRFECAALPLVHFPEFPSRWSRPGLLAEVERARDAGVWWPELHGLVHLPQAAWLGALRGGAPDALLAHAHQCFVCAAVEAAAEYDPGEPAEVRSHALAHAVERFRERFGRAPDSLCAPDYRWDERLEADAEALGVTTLQGRSEQMGHRFRRLRHQIGRLRWRGTRGRRFDMPARIAFEPRGDASSGSRLGASAAHRKARAAWGLGQPAVISSHRLNYAHLDPAWPEAGRAALRDLLALLAREGAIFLTDAEVRSLHERAWSLRPLAGRTALLRSCGATRARVRIPAPAGTTGVSLIETHGQGAPRFAIEAGGTAAELVAELGPGEYVLEWTGA